MELELGEYQELLRATTRSFLEAESPIAAVRALADDPAGFDPATWKAGTALGWTSLLVEEADGGGSVSGNGVADVVLVAEELGRMVAPGPLVPCNVVASGLGGWGDVDRRRSTLARIMEGDLVAAWAYAERPGSECWLAAQPDGSYLLSGTKTPVEAGAQAGVFLVASGGDGGPFQVVVDADADGITVTPRGSVDLTRRFADVTFDGVRVEAADIVGTPATAGPSVQRQFALAVVMQCAETVGVVDRMFSVTLEMLGDRYSFGRVLSSYQALKHRCADMKLGLEACHATATAAARALAAGREDAGELASVAKAWIGPTATEILQECVQLHGGIGVTWDHDLHLYLRRATVNRGTYGTPDDHLAGIADALLGVPA